MQKDKAVILLSGWRATQAQYWLFSTLIALQGYHCLTYTYDKEILNPNPQRTVKNVTNVVADIVTEVTRLHKHGVHDITLFGTSLGSVLAILAAKQAPQVDTIILNTSGYDIAKIIWSWDSFVPHFKKQIVDQGINLKQLSQAWTRINPKNNLIGLTTKKVLLLSSQVDTVIPFEQAEKLFRALTKVNRSTRFVVTSTFGHLSFGAINLLRAAQYVRSIQG